MFYQVLINQNLYYLRLLLREDVEISAIHVVNSGLLGYRKFVSDYRTTLISIAISFIS